MTVPTSDSEPRTEAQAAREAHTPDANDFAALRQNRDSWQHAAESAEAREAELAEALEKIVAGDFPNLKGDMENFTANLQALAHTALRKVGR